MIQLRVLRRWYSRGRERVRWEEIENHHEKLGLGELHVQDNLPFLIQQVQLPIKCKIHQYEVFKIQLGMLYRWFLASSCILHMIPIMKPHHTFSSTTLPSLQYTKLAHSSQSLHSIIMSLHWVEHTPSTAYTEDYSIHPTFSVFRSSSRLWDDPWM